MHMYKLLQFTAPPTLEEGLSFAMLVQVKIYAITTKLLSSLQLS